MTDKNAAESPERQNENADDFLELGEVKKDTKGHFLGKFFDGGLGWWG